MKGTSDKAAGSDVERGDKMFDFNLIDLDGNPHSMSEH